MEDALIEQVQPVLMVVGPSQVGKSTMIAALIKNYGYSFLTPHTTREPRSGEIDGRDYHFLTRARFQQLIRDREFVDWDYFLGNYGGIERRSFLVASTRPVVLHVLARMALRLEQRFQHAIAVFIAPADISVVYERVSARFTDPAIARARYAHVDEEMLHAPLFQRTLTIDRATTVDKVAHDLNALRMTEDTIRSRV